MKGNTNLRRLVLAHGVSRMGGAAGFFIGLWGKAAFDLDATPGQLSLLVAATGIAAIVGAAIAGVLIDRWDARRVLLLGEALFIPAVSSLVLAQDLRTLTLLAPFVWLTLSLPHTAMNSFPPALSDDPVAIERANVGLEAGGTAAFILGPAVGAVIGRLLGTDAVFVFDALTSLVALWLVRGVTVRRAPERERGTGGAELREGFRYVLASPPLRMVLYLGTLTWLSFGVFSALEPLFFRDVLGTGVDALGWVNALFGIGLATGTYVLHRLQGRLTTVGALAVLTAGGGLGAIVYTSTTSLLVVALGALYWGGVLGMVLPIIRTLAHLHSREGYVGRVMGVVLIQHNVGELLPLALAPTLAVAFGVQRTFWLVGAVIIVGSIVAIGAARRVDVAAPAGAPPSHPLGPGPLPELPDAGTMPDQLAVPGAAAPSDTAAQQT